MRQCGLLRRSRRLVRGNQVPRWLGEKDSLMAIGFKVDSNVERRIAQLRGASASPP